MGGWLICSFVWPCPAGIPTIKWQFYRREGWLTDNKSGMSLYPAGCRRAVVREDVPKPARSIAVSLWCQTALFVVVWSVSLWCQCHICYQAANSNDAAAHRLKETQLDPVQCGECFKDWFSQGYKWEWLDKIQYRQKILSNTLFFSFLTFFDIRTLWNWKELHQKSLNPLSWHLDSCYANCPYGSIK